MQLTFDILAPRKTLEHIPVEDPRASALADRHYSRQTEGATGVIAPGKRFLLWHVGTGGIYLRTGQRAT